MTSHSIRKVHIFAAPMTWVNYNHGVIYDEVKNKAAVSTAFRQVYMNDIYSSYYGDLQEAIARDNYIHSIIVS